MAPETVAHYRLKERLGAASMGEVWLAEDSRLHRLVALKMILAGDYAGAEHKARFLAEARAVARFQHPHIVQIHEIGEHQGRPYFSLEFVEGGNLVFDARVGEPAAMPGIMREMLAAQPDAIVAIGPAPLAAAGAATRRVPIVGFGAEAVAVSNYAAHLVTSGVDLGRPCSCEAVQSF